MKGPPRGKPGVPARATLSAGLAVALRRLARLQRYRRHRGGALRLPADRDARETGRGRVEFRTDGQLHRAAGGRGRPVWLSSTGSDLSVSVTTLPKREDIDPTINEQLIVELYSK